MQYSHEVELMQCVAKGCNHGPAPIPEEGKWVQAYDIKDISGLTHGCGCCAPQQGTCKLTLNIKNGVIEEALVETIGCSGMTHSAAMAAETASDLGEVAITSAAWASGSLASGRPSWRAESTQAFTMAAAWG